MAELHLGAEGYSTDGTNGKVGIGTSSPSEVLTVSDTSQLSIGNGKGNGGANEIQIKAPAALLLGTDSKTNGNEFVRFATENGRNWIQSFEATSGNPQAAALALTAGLSRGIEIDTSGKVGVGISNPAKKLSVQDSGNSTQAIFGQGNTSGQSQILIGEADQTQKSMVIGYDHSNGYGYINPDGYSIGSALVISNVACVGINTTTPGVALDVNGDVNISGTHVLGFGGAGGPQISKGSGAPGFSAPNGSLYLRTDGTGPNLYVRQNGSWVSK
jgi:hypothetical protein